ncbi:MAG: PaaD-like protein (DUF59) involved in Fe-S cluster assembly, partial [uncultured Friedmanniella sp.]
DRHPDGNRYPRRRDRRRAAAVRPGQRRAARRRRRLDLATEPGGPRGGPQGRRRPRAGHQRRRPRPDLRPEARGRRLADHRHDAHLGGLPAHRRHRGPDGLRARGPGQRLRHQLGLDAAVGSGEDHRRRPRAAASARLQRL